MKVGTEVALTVSGWGQKSGDKAVVIENDGGKVSLRLLFKNGKKLWFQLDECRPLKTAVAARSASTNSSYTAALREKCRKYFQGVDSVSINNFIKSVQRLNASKAKHCV